VKVLVLGAGGAASNGFSRALKLAGGYELVGTNCSETDLLLSECDSNHLIAPVGDYLQWRVDLDQVIRKTKPDFVHAQNDAEVEALGWFRTTVHMHGAKTFLPSSEVIKICRDKLVSYKRWGDAGIRVPLTLLAAGRGDLVMVHEQFGEVWLRPRTGAGGQKSLRTKNFQLAREWLNHHDGWGEFTVAEPLTADTVTVQQLYWKGELVCSQQRTRASWANSGSSATGVSGSTGVGVTSSDAEADRIADAAVAAVDRAPHGLYGVDMCRAEDGTPCPTEINIGRFFTTAPEFFASAGFNMADVYEHRALGVLGASAADMGIYNPLPDGLRWIRGMDRAPVLA
jgi:hypothetical protein